MRRRRARLLVILLAVTMSTVLEACGGASSGASVQHTRPLTPGACSTSEAGDAAAPGQVTMRVAPHAAPVTTLPPGVTVGQVRVVVENGERSPDSNIFAWVGNGLGQCIYATDHHSDCSIIVLERQVDGAWQPEAKCQSATPTRTIVLPPMQAVFIRLMPITTGAQQGTWQTGTYRVAFRYRLDQDAASQPAEVDSATFVIA